MTPPAPAGGGLAAQSFVVEEIDVIHSHFGWPAGTRCLRLDTPGVERGGDAVVAIPGHLQKLISECTAHRRSSARTGR